jgi:hypothetical protein
MLLEEEWDVEGDQSSKVFIKREIGLKNTLGLSRLLRGLDSSELKKKKKKVDMLTRSVSINFFFSIEMECFRLSVSFYLKLIYF